MIGDRKIDYLIINHMEPDHSGSLALIKQHYPDIVLVGNKKTFDMVEGYYGVTGERLVVADGDSLNVGHHKLNFYLIPMVHWPETMVTFDSTEGILFAGDISIAGALNGGCIDKDINIGYFIERNASLLLKHCGKFKSGTEEALQKCSERS